MQIIFKKLKIGQIGIFNVEIPYLIVGQGKPKGAIISLLHGGEQASLEVISKFLDLKAKLKGQAVIFPIANPFGQIFSERNEIIEGKNLNRLFPGNKKGDFANKLAAKLFEFCLKSDFVIDLHNFSRLSPLICGFSLTSQTPLKIVNKMIKALAPEVVWITDTKKGEDQRFKGALDEKLSEKGIPAIFIEIPRLNLVSENTLNKTAQGILRVFNTFNKKNQKNEVFKILGFEAKYLYAEKAGLFKPIVRPLAKIKKDQVLGELTDLFTFKKTVIKSSLSGTLLTIKPKEVIRMGTKLASVGKPITVVVK